MIRALAESDFPATYQEADRASLLAQTRYLRTFSAILGSTILSATFSWLVKLNGTYHQLAAYSAAVCALASLILTLLLKERRYENSWYMGRAIAESVKTRAWSYMMRAGPYKSDDDSNPQNQVDRDFVADIGKILKERGPLVLARGRDESSQEISDAMCEIRKSRVIVRRDLYLQERIVDQKKWYSNKAAHSGEMENKLFILVIAAQAVAVAFSFYVVAQSHGPSALVGVVASASSSTHYCPAINRTESTDCMNRVTQYWSQVRQVPVEWGFSRRG